jgi:hypothetical protein
MAHFRYLGFDQKQVPDRRRISNKMTLTLTLSRPTGEGTARSVSCTFYSGWKGLATEHDSPSPIRWERAGVRVSTSQIPMLFLQDSLDGLPAHELTIGRCNGPALKQTIAF